MSETVLHVPLVMAGGLPEGIRIAQPVENVDNVPTLVDLIGADTAATFHGESLRPLVRKGTRSAWLLGVAPICNVLL